MKRGLWWLLGILAAALFVAAWIVVAHSPFHFPPVAV